MFSICLLYTSRWWGNNPIEKCQEEIDIMAVQEPYALFGECKWKNAPVDMQVVNTLIKRGTLFHYSEKCYFIFSKCGFQNTVIQYAGEHSDMSLVSYQQICEISVK